MTPDDTSTELRDDAGDTRFPRWLKWGLLGALAVLVVGYGLIFLYAKVLNDGPDELGASDLDRVLGEPADDEPAATSAPVAPATSEPGQTGTTEATDTIEATGASAASEVTAPTTAPSGDPPPTTGATPPAGAGALWEVTDDSELGYRVKEILFGVSTEGVGRTNQIEGALTIDGTEVTAAEFVVDVASITSDESRRDSQFRGRIMSTDEFPQAVFTLTEPIELGTEAVEGATVETTATGDLTLRGVTNPVTFDVSARLENDRIGVLGSIPVVFADYGIANPSIAGITTEDNGLLEFVLVFAPTP